MRLWKTLMTCWDELAFFSKVPHLAPGACALRAALSRLGEGQRRAPLLKRPALTSPVGRGRAEGAGEGGPSGAGDGPPLPALSPRGERETRRYGRRRLCRERAA